MLLGRDLGGRCNLDGSDGLPQLSVQTGVIYPDGNHLIVATEFMIARA